MNGKMKPSILINKFIGDLRNLNYSEKTLETYQFNIESYYHSKLSIEEYLNRKGISASTRNKELTILSTYFKHMIRIGMLDENPTVGVKASKTPRELPHTVTMRTMNQILDSIDGTDFISLRDKALLEVAVAIGARTGDFDNLSIESLNLGEGVITVFGKGSFQVTQHLTNAAIESLKRYLPEREKIAKCNNLFVNSRGGGLRSVYYIFKKYLGDTKPHDFNRHSVAVMLLRNGMKIHELREFMRHSNITTTSRYLNVTKEDLKDACKQAHPRNA